MKRKIGFALMGLAMLASCTQESDVNVIDEGQEIISLGASTGVSTRAAINDLAGLSAATAGVGIYGQATTATTAGTAITSEWTASPLMKNVKTTAIDATTGKMSWETPVYYPKTAPLSVKFFAYYPYAAEGSSGDNYVKTPETGAAPVLHFTLTGDEDLMWATPVLGSRTAPAAALKFNHQLTQMTFKLVDGEKNFSKSITAITVKTNATGDMNVENGVISNWTGSKGLPLTTGVTIDMSKAPEVDGARVYTLPKTVMIQPEQASFEVSVTIDGNPKTVTVKPIGDKTFKVGKAYSISLRLTGDVPVQLSAEIVPWVTGGAGEGNVE